MSLFSKGTLWKHTYQHVTSLRRSYGKIGVLGVPFEEGQTKKGVGRGPEAIRNSGIIAALKELGHEVVDYGDVTYEIPAQPEGAVPNMKKLSHIAAAQKETSAMVQKILQDDCRCLTIGGDHSIGIGTIDGHIKAKQDVSVLWIDAHADLNTATTSPTGNVHGMPVALLAKELSDYWPYLQGMDWQKPLLSTKNLAYIGLRDIDDYERVIIDKFNIMACGMEDVTTYGIQEVVRRCLKHIDPLMNRSLHVSFDIDALDPLEAPSTGTPVRGGLTLREGVQIMEQVYHTGRMHALDIVEVNPSIGDARDVNMTVQAAQYIIRTAFGMVRQGLSLPHLRNITDIPIPNGTSMPSKD